MLRLSFLRSLPDAGCKLFLVDVVLGVVSLDVGVDAAPAGDDEADVVDVVGDGVMPGAEVGERLLEADEFSEFVVVDPECLFACLIDVEVVFVSEDVDEVEVVTDE